MLVCGCGIFTMLLPGIGTQWNAEPTPPEPVSHLEPGSSGEVVAQTNDGTMYEFQYGSPSSWEKVSQASGSPVLGMHCSTGGEGNHIVLPPPGDEVSRVRVNCVMFETAYHLEVALLDNGEIWSWKHERYAYTELFVSFILLAGFCLGVIFLIVGAGMFMYIKYKSPSD